MPYPSYIDYGVAVARGETENGGKSTIRGNFKYSRSTVLSTANTTVWDRNTLYSFYASSTLLKIASSDAGDATGGSGAVTVMITGVNNDYEEITETIALEGVTPVTTTNDFLSINTMRVNSSGANNTNDGNITVIANDQALSTFTGAGVPTTTSNVQAQILAGLGRTLMGVYTVPVSLTSYMTEMHVSSSITKNITVELYEQPFGEAFQIRSSVAFSRQTIDRGFSPPLPFPAKSRIEFRGKSSSTAGNVAVEWNMIQAEGDN